MRRTRGWDGMDQDPPSEPAGSVSTIAVIRATSTPCRSPPESAVRTRGWSRPSHATAWSLPPRHQVRHAVRRDRRTIRRVARRPFRVRPAVVGAGDAVIDLLPGALADVVDEHPP